MSSPSAQHQTHVQSCLVQYQISLAWQSYSSSLGQSHLSPSIILGPSLSQNARVTPAVLGLSWDYLILQYPHDRVSQNARVTCWLLWDYLIPQYPQDRVSQNARLHRRLWDYRGICTVRGIPWVVLGGSPVTAKTPIRLQLNSAFVRPHDIFKSGSRCSLFNVILSKSQAIHFVGLTY